jgi:hypothetical protein
MDWWQIFYSFIGSFLGFGFALIAESIIVAINGNIRITRLVNNLNDELGYIYKSYYDSKSKSIKDTKAYFNTPIWDSVISTGDILVLLKKDKEYYDKVLSVYSKVYVIEKMETEKNVGYVNFIKNDKEYVVKHIQNLLRMD